MTALQWIVKEAKSIKKAYPNRFAKWTDYVKQASAIYASKHKGKSPVGKKKAVKKTPKKKVGVIKKKIVKKAAPKKIIKKHTHYGKIKSHMRRVNGVTKKLNQKYVIYNIDTKKEIVGFNNLADAKEVLRDFKYDGDNVKIINNTKTTKTKRKKPSEKDVLNSIKHAESVQKKHMSVGNYIGDIAIDKFKKVNNDIINLENALLKNIETSKKFQYKTPFWKKYLSDKNKKIKSLIKELKTHAKELKKHI